MTRKTLVVANDMVVRLDYTLTLGDGEVYDSSADSGPLEYLQGSGEIITGLETAILGMAVGEEKDVVVTPDYAYGEYDPEATEWLPPDLFGDDVELEPGMELELYDEEAEEDVVAFVSEIQPDGVLVDFNHPLAGETLRFHVKVLGARPAKPDELAHGHSHGPGNHH